MRCRPTWRWPSPCWSSWRRAPSAPSRSRGKTPRWTGAGGKFNWSIEYPNITSHIECMWGLSGMPTPVPGMSPSCPWGGAPRPSSVCRRGCSAAQRWSPSARRSSWAHEAPEIGQHYTLSHKYTVKKPSRRGCFSCTELSYKLSTGLMNFVHAVASDCLKNARSLGTTF